MTENPARKIESQRELIREHPEVSDAEREAIIEFSDRLKLLREQYSDQRHIKLLEHVSLMARNCDADIAEAVEDRETAEDVVRWIHSNYENSNTNSDFRDALRVFGKRVTEGDDVPDAVSWITTTQSDYDPTPDPADMITWEEVEDMIDVAYNARNKAMVAVAWDAGARSGEFRDLTLGDVSDHKHGLRIRVDGKTGKRSITLIPSVPHLNRWLSEHPGDSDDAPLWCKLNTAEPISYNMYRKTFRQLAENAGVSKPVTLTNFRRSRASHLASQGMSQAHLEDRFGWVRGSDAAAHYVSVFTEESEREFARLHGIDVSEDEPDKLAPLECPRCGLENQRDADMCERCGLAFSDETFEELESLQTRAMEHVAENPGDVNVVKYILEGVELDASTQRDILRRILD